MESNVVLKKSDLDAFMVRLAKSRQVLAPVKKGIKNFSFEEVKSSSRISLKYIPTILPPKKFFMPPCEKIQTFDKRTHQWTPMIESGGKLAIFGVHTCDLSGIQYLNTVMSVDPKDVNYEARRANIHIIGLECNDYCDQYASCKAMNNHLPNGGYDLFFTELDKCFFVHVGSPEGEAIVNETGVFSKVESSHQKELEDIRLRKQKIFQNEFNVKQEDLKGLLENTISSNVWQDLDKRCIACGNCTNVCPTCYCFDIRDELNLDLSTGFRQRMWDGCQNEEFAKVAGGENFRHKRGHRQRHRYLRKFAYPVDKFKRYSCTGCGRCTRTCMAKISLKETINALAGSSK